MDTATLIAAIGGAAGVGTGGVALYMARAQRKKIEVDTESTVVTTAVDMAERLTATAGSLIGPLQSQLQQAQQDLVAMRERIATLEARADRTSQEYQDCREREIRAMQHEKNLREELNALRGFVKARREEDLFPRPGAAPRPEREIWTPTQREEFRRQQRINELKDEMEQSGYHVPEDPAA